MTDEIEYTVICHPMDDTPDGHFSDERDVEFVWQQIREGNDWGWCVVEVRAAWMGLSASAYLGACSYASQEDFEKCGYYADLKHEAESGVIDQAMGIAEALISA